ncbi:MAG: helix-turn-helix transcriptional regulator [Nostoc sp.]|uniref:helix-turn-helix domain-containing protein n=1 Tax=Nostoc sp. TaxID=1180 RepID=UPI002FF77030
MTIYLDLETLASLVRKKRGSKGLREAATEIAELGSASPSTLSRVENGKMPDMETFLALCNWLQVPPAEFFKNTEEVQLSTPDAIAIQLQADNNLDPAIANALASLIKAAYRDLCQGNC